VRDGESKPAAVLQWEGTMPAIEIDKLAMTYKTELFQRPKEALKGVTFDVEENEIFGYLGANGAGKTTTIKILAGLVKQTGGTARISGVDIIKIAARKNLGFLPENPYFYEYLTAPESLAFYARLLEVPRRERKQRIGEMLSLVELDNVPKVRVKHYSKGMRQRLGLAQALLNDPKVLILDEPMSGLDPVGRHKIRRLITEQKERGRTVFFSSHILSDVEAICDRVAMLKEGALLSVGVLGELLEAHVKSIEISARNVPESAVNALRKLAPGLRTEGEFVFLVAEDYETSNRAAKLILESGGLLSHHTAQKESLEEYFYKETASAAEREAKPDE